MYHIVGHKAVNYEDYQKNSKKHQMAYRKIAHTIVANEHVKKENCTADPHQIAQRPGINGKCNKRPDDHYLQQEWMAKKGLESSPEAKHIFLRMFCRYLSVYRSGQNKLS
jgi:hypothetical protein